MTPPPSEVPSVTVGLLLGIVVFVAGLAVTFAGRRLRGRVEGLAAMALGALIAVAGAPPEPSVVVGVTVGTTLVPLVAIASWLRRRLLRDADDHDGQDATLDAEPR